MAGKTVKISFQRGSGFKKCVGKYRAANGRQRLFMLLGLFTLSTQRELSVMLRAEFDLAKATCRHIRNKTGVRGVFWLPPELVTLLEAEFRNTPSSDGLAFTTRTGKPLVHFPSGTSRSDAVSHAWASLIKKAKVKGSFKLLRKHAAKMIKSIAGRDVAAWALSHSTRDNVTEKHYANNRDYAKVIEAQKEMYRELAPMFAAAQKVKEGEAAA